MLCLGFDAHYWKPVQSGIEERDSTFIERSGIEKYKIFPERYLLTEALSPHLAAKIDSKKIELSDFSLPSASSYKNLIVEGAGGVLVPLNDQVKVIDLIVHLSLPVLLTCRSTLGTINHSLLSIEALRARQINIAGLVMIGPENPENKIALEKFGKVNVLAEIPWLADFTKKTLLETFKSNFKGASALGEIFSTNNLASVHSDAHGRTAAESQKR